MPAPVVARRGPLSHAIGWGGFLARSLAAALTRWRLRRDAPRSKFEPLIVAAASWEFPVYSQKFVHEEALALARAGFSLRFLYGAARGRSELAGSCADLWSLRRRLVLSPDIGARDLAYFRQRHPSKVEALIGRLSKAAALSRVQLEAHPHFLEAFSFARYVEALGADYIHTYFFYEQTFFALVTSELLGIPRGVSCYADHLLDDYALKLVPLHLETCDVVVATSSRIRSELEEIHGSSLVNALVKPNAIDTSPYRSRRRSLPRSDQAWRLLCVSRIDRKKGLEFFLRAIRLLLDTGIRVEASIIGAPDLHAPDSVAYHASLLGEIERLRLDRVVGLEGFKENEHVGAALDAAHIFVVPSVDLANGDKDGIPTALIEAMASGIAIVATDAGSIAEAVDHEKEALLVPQHDPEAVALAVRRLTAEGELALRLGSAAAERARRQFHIADSEEPFHRAIHAAIGSRRPDLGEFPR